MTTRDGMSRVRRDEKNEILCRLESLVEESGPEAAKESVNDLVKNWMYEGVLTNDQARRAAKLVEVCGL